MKLTPAQITAVYEEIGLMRVDIDPNPNRGLQYVKERVALCQVMLDRVRELLLQVYQAYGTVLQEELAVEMEIRLRGESTMLENRLDLVGGEKQDHKLLVEMLKLTHTSLRQSYTSIKLLADLTKEQIKLGEVDPKDAPGVVQDLPVTDLVPRPPVEVGPTGGGNTVTLADQSAILAERTGPSAGEPSPETPVDFDDLFGALYDARPSDRIA